MLQAIFHSQRIKRLALLVGFVFSSIHLQAIPWSNSPFTYTARNEPVSKLLKQFCISQGIICSISQHLEGKVTKQIESKDANQTWNQLCIEHNILWFFDGLVLHIQAANELERKIYPGNIYNESIITNIIAQMGLETNRLVENVITVGTKKVFSIYAQTVLIETIDQALKSINQNTGFSEKYFVKTYALKHAWANDQEFDTDGNTFTIPGVVTILSELVKAHKQKKTDDSLELDASNKNSFRVQETVEDKSSNNPKSKLFSFSTNEEEDDEGLNSLFPQLSTNKKEEFETIQPSFVADPRTNSIIIRDLKNRQPVYDQIIAELDQSQELIEIQVVILDLDYSYSHNLGLNLTNVSNSGGQVFSLSPLDSELQGLMPPNISAVVNARKVNIQINALVNDGHAKIVSQPTITTTSNQPATLGNKQNVFARSEGERVADLFRVSAGLTLNVTPSVIQSDDIKKVKMKIQLEDGNLDFTGTTSSNDIPRAIQHNLTTETLVPLGKSLIIGGYYQKSTEKQDSGIPVLKEIPVVGRIFQNKKNTDKTVQRLFIISPKIAGYREGLKEAMDRDTALEAYLTPNSQ